MNEGPDKPKAEAQEPSPEATSQAQEEPFGGEVRVPSGGSPQWLRWLIYLFHVWAVVYLAVHPRVEGQVIVLVFAGIIAGWLLFFALTRRPPEL